MPDLPRQEPDFGSGLEATIAHEQTPVGAGEPDVPPGENVGEYLRQNRLRMGKTLADISRASKIVPHHLNAIENNAFEQLPGRAYAIGFVRSYAACLGLDACPLIARLKTELNEVDENPVFACPNPPGRRNQTLTVSPASSDAGAVSAEAPSRRQGWLAGAAQKVLQLQNASLMLRIREIAHVAGDLKLDFPSAAASRNQPGKGLTGNDEDREPEFAFFPPAKRGDQTRPAYAGNGDAKALTVGVVLGSTFVTSAQKTRQPQKAKVPGSGRGLPLPTPPDHPLRTWVTAGIMTAVIMYFGYSIIHSGPRVEPPAVTPVPARLAAEAAFIPDNVAPPAVATPGQSAPGAFAPVAVPAAKDQPGDATAIEKPATASREPAYDLPRDAAPAQLESATLEPKHVFRGQLPLGERYGEQNRGSRITLRVHRTTFVAVLGLRNHQYIDRILRAGDTYRVPNMRGLKLSTRDAGAVEVILDGNTVGFAGEDGAAVKGMSLQPQNIISRFHWLQE